MSILYILKYQDINYTVVMPHFFIIAENTL